MGLTNIKQSSCDTFLLSTVLKPISDILGSFSPSSRPIKTFIASENIPRSVRTRTCWNETTQSHWTLYKTFAEMATVSSSEGVISSPGQSSSSGPDNIIHQINPSLMDNKIGQANLSSYFSLKSITAFHSLNKLLK